METQRSSEEGGSQLERCSERRVCVNVCSPTSPTVCVTDKKRTRGYYAAPLDAFGISRTHKGRLLLPFSPSEFDQTSFFLVASGLITSKTGCVSGGGGFPHPRCRFVSARGAILMAVGWFASWNPPPPSKIKTSLMAGEPLLYPSNVSAFFPEKKTELVHD